MREPARVKVLLVESGRAVGGTERVLWELATRLPASRYEVRVWLSPASGVDELARALEEAGIPVESADTTMVPSNSIELGDEGSAKQVLRVIDALEDHDDVQGVYANFDIPEAVLEAVMG